MDNLPAIPGGVGIVSDVLASITTPMTEAGNIVGEYDAIRAHMKQRGIKLPKGRLSRYTRAIKPWRIRYLCLRLKLAVTLAEYGYPQEAA